MSHEHGAEEIARHLETVEQMARAGRPRLAAAAFDAAMRDCLPDLPLRFSMLLVRADEDQAAELARAVYRQEDIVLRLADGPRGVLSVFHGKMRLGDLSARDDELVRGFGSEGLAIYEARILEIIFRDDETLQSVAIELVRPEQRPCPRCRRPHDGMLLHCARCRAEEGAEAAPPAALAEALEDIVRLHGGEIPGPDPT